MKATHILADHPDRPAVVCLSGAGGLWPDWLPVAGLMSDQAHVVAIQRPAVRLLLDEAAEQVAATIGELPQHQALLVAHSMGGFVAEAMARLHPELVSGLMFVDSSVAHPHNRMMSLTEGVMEWGATKMHQLLDRYQLRPILGPLLRRQVEPVPVRTQDGRRRLVDEITHTAEHWELVAADLADYEPWNDDLLSLRHRKPLPGIPITVISAVRHPSRQPHSWAAQQDRLVTLFRADPGSPAVRHVVLHGAPHLVQLSHPNEVATEAATLL